MPNKYEEKQEARRERLLARADKAQADSDHHWQASHDAVKHIPLGQPILVGHHSEGRHRADLKRCHRHADKSVELKAKASELRHRAAAVGKGGISSDDPEAIEKLTAKVIKLKARRETLKRINALWRKAGRPGPELPDAWIPIEKELDLDLTTTRRSMEACPWEKSAVPRWELTNLGANIKRIEQRIKDLEATRKEPAAPEIRGPGFSIIEDQDDNRIVVRFDTKPPKEVTRIVRQHGFLYSPSRIAHIRKISPAGRNAARWLSEALKKESILKWARALPHRANNPDCQCDQCCPEWRHQPAGTERSSTT